MSDYPASGATPADQSPESADHAGSDNPAGVQASQIEAELRAQIDDAHRKYMRSLADFQNFQRRALMNEQEARVQGRTGVVQSVLTVIDHFDLALGQDPSKATAEQIMTGVKVIRDELLKALQAHGVTPIVAAKGDMFDPTRHEAVMHQQSEGVESGHVVTTLQAGYSISVSTADGPADRTIRPAKVSIAP